MQDEHIAIVDTPYLTYSIIYVILFLFQVGYKVAYLTFTQYMILMVPRGFAQLHAKAAPQNSTSILLILLKRKVG